MNIQTLISLRVFARDNPFCLSSGLFVCQWICKVLLRTPQGLRATLSVSMRLSLPGPLRQWAKLAPTTLCTSDCFIGLDFRPSVAVSSRYTLPRFSSKGATQNCLSKFHLQESICRTDYRPSALVIFVSSLRQARDLELPTPT